MCKGVKRKRLIAGCLLHIGSTQASLRDLLAFTFQLLRPTLMSTFFLSPPPLRAACRNQLSQSLAGTCLSASSRLLLELPHVVSQPLQLSHLYFIQPMSLVTGHVSQLCFFYYSPHSIWCPYLWSVLLCNCTSQRWLGFFLLWIYLCLIFKGT